MPTICKRHPLSETHIETLALLVNEAIEEGRADANTTHDELASLFELRGVIAAMQRKPEAKPKRTRRNAAQRELGTFPVPMPEDQSA